MWAAIAAAFKNVGAFIAAIQALVALIREIRAIVAAQKVADQAKNNQELEKAVDDAAKATTPEEAFDAQERIVDNSHP